MNFKYKRAGNGIQSEIEVTDKTCQDLLAAADMFGLSDVTTACCGFLATQLHPSNCIGIFQFAESHSCLKLMKISEAYIENHFLQIVQEDEFLAMPKDNLIYLLKSENLKIDHELQVFQAALKWLLHNPSERRRAVFDVVAPIRFPIVAFKPLEKTVDDVADFSLKIALKKLLQDYHTDRRLPFEVKLSRLKLCQLQPRKNSRKKIYIIGGYSRPVGGRWSDLRTLSKNECFDSFQQEWIDQAPLRCARSGLGVAVLNGLIYAIGGENDSLIYDTVECFDPSQNKWTFIPNMTYPRSALAVCAFDEFIFAFGGWIGSEIGDCIEVYDPNLNLWKRVGAMKTKRVAMSIVEHQGLLYVIGGVSDLGLEMSLVESYNPVIQEWVTLASMHTKRAHFGAAVLDDYIYVVGGSNGYGDVLNTMERYSPILDKWQEMPNLSIGRAGPCVTTINGMIYVMGGHKAGDELHAPETLDTVECFDPQTSSWIEVGYMLSSHCEAGVAVL
ncbi:actin-binding protein IPP-like isoform X2 [Tubulanus polymorphus]|uniref:actin-binding protein IPP-like isoform X2 n=1 Tax=Tubulanus polymorphus TaxID=672921 RepID=UPI003DA3429B